MRLALFLALLPLTFPVLASASENDRRAASLLELSIQASTNALLTVEDKNQSEALQAYRFQLAHLKEVHAKHQNGGSAPFESCLMAHEDLILMIETTIDQMEGRKSDAHQSNLEALWSDCRMKLGR